MEKRFDIFDYLAQIFTVFGVTVLLLNIFVLIFGEGAKDFSAIFSLGSSGLSIAAMLEFLFASAAAVTLRTIFLTDTLIKSMSLTLRMILMFTSLFAVIVGCIAVFEWFPVSDVRAWVMFLICFAVSCTASTLISAIREKQSNKALENALNKYKGEL